MIGVIGLALAGCASLRPFGTRPSALAGVWIDSTKTTPSDSSYWVLGSDGSDRTRRVERAMSQGSSQPHVTEQDYGVWWLAGSLDDTVGRRLCIRRHGRSTPATCFSFTLDSTRSAAPPIRRLLLKDYRGNNSLRDRVLLEQRP